MVFWIKVEVIDFPIQLFIKFKQHKNVNMANFVFCVNTWTLYQDGNVSVLYEYMCPPEQLSCSFKFNKVECVNIVTLCLCPNIVSHVSHCISPH